MEETKAEQSKWDAAVDCCAQCGAKTTKMLKCSRCRACFYCSVACQRKAYKQHKKQCFKIAKEKQAAGSAWGITTHEMPQLPVEHPRIVEPNEAGVKLAKEVLATGTMPSSVTPFNPILAMWMQGQCALTHVELRKVSDRLMDSESLEISTPALALRAIILIGCSAAGQPTLEEVLQFKIGFQSVTRLALTMHECAKATLANGDEFFWARSRDTMTCPVGALAMLTMMSMTGMMGMSPDGGDIFAMMDNFIFHNTGAPTVALDAGTVERDVQAVLRAVGVSDAISINARMHATSFRVLTESGVPIQIADQRHTPSFFWTEVN
jgi:hypothetical protein